MRYYRFHRSSRKALFFILTLIFSCVGLGSCSPNVASGPTLPFRDSDSTDMGSGGVDVAATCSELYEEGHPTVDDRIHLNSDSYVYGEIKIATPVMETYDWSEQKKQMGCDKGVGLTPVIRMKLQIIDASWDDAQDSTVTVRIPFDNWWQRTGDTHPYVSPGTDTLKWTDGQRYLQPGQRIGAHGRFLKRTGELYVLPRDLFAVNKEGDIQHYFESKYDCLIDSWNGRPIHRVMKRLRKASGGKKIMLTTREVPPDEFYSKCNHPGGNVVPDPYLH